MTIYSFLLSLSLGLLIGVAYGFSFLLQKRRTLSTLITESGSISYRTKIIRLIFSMSRLVILALLWLYLFRSPAVDIAIIVPSFLLSFWFVLLKRKNALRLED